MEITILLTLVQGTEDTAERAPDVRGPQAEEAVLLSESGHGPANPRDATKDVPVCARHTADWRTESLLLRLASPSTPPQGKRGTQIHCARL